MVRHLLQVAVIFVIGSMSLFGKIWQLNNNSGQYANFISFSEVLNSPSVNAGDTLYVSGSLTPYGGVPLTKKLVIIGTGYFLSENQPTHSKLAASKFDAFTFQSGSEGSIVEGIEVIGSMYIYNTNNITIKRNKINLNLTFAGSNLVIIQNYVGGTLGNDGTGNSPSGAYNNTIIANNYCDGAIYGLNSCDAIIYNNIAGYMQIHNSSVENNITKSLNASLYTNCVVKNNASVNSDLPNANGNINGIILANTFTQTGSTDGKWQLKGGSPAIGTGSNGTDMGIFGGSSPYVLSGIPNIPTIYDYKVNATGTNATGLQVIVKAKSRN